MPAIGFLSFAWHNRRFLSFGLLMTFFASFGQTYFIGIYGTDIRTAFDLSHGMYGAIYSGATVLSASCLLWLGRSVDRMDLRLFATLVCVGLIVAMLSIGSAVGPITLFFSLFALRLTGQGLMVHTAVTSMARYFDAARGRAVSLIMLGVSAGVAIMPAAASFTTEWIGWRESWWVFAGLTAIILIPLIRHTLKDHGGHNEPQTRAAQQQAQTSSEWPLSAVIRDPRFLTTMIAAAAPPFIITGLFFHHAQLATEKGWSIAWLATAFVAYSAASAPASLLSGTCVDRWQARRMLPFMLLPLAVSLGILVLWQHPVTAILYLGLAGAGMGITSPILGALWAELYGTSNLGAIRSVQSTLMIFSSALSPVVIGWLIDSGTSMAAIAAGCSAYTLIASGILLLTFLNKQNDA